MDSKDFGAEGSAGSELQMSKLKLRLLNQKFDFANESDEFFSRDNYDKTRKLFIKIGTKVTPADLRNVFEVSWHTGHSLFKSRHHLNAVWVQSTRDGETCPKYRSSTFQTTRAKVSPTSPFKEDLTRPGPRRNVVPVSDTFRFINLTIHGFPLFTFPLIFAKAFVPSLLLFRLRRRLSRNLSPKPLFQPDTTRRDEQKPRPTRGPCRLRVEGKLAGMSKLDEKLKSRTNLPRHRHLPEIKREKRSKFQMSSHTVNNFPELRAWKYRPDLFRVPKPLRHIPELSATNLPETLPKQTSACWRSAANLKVHKPMKWGPR